MTHANRIPQPLHEELAALRQRVAELEADAADHTRAEAELQRTNETTVAANRAMSELLMSLSSEIRTPLNGVIGMTELALDTSLTDTQREYLELAKASEEDLLSVMSNLLDFSRIESDHFEVDPIEFNLRDSLGYTMGTLALRAHEWGLELVCHVLSNVPDTLVGDPGILRQIVANVVVHAFHSTTRGVVTLRVKKDQQTDDTLTLRVEVTITKTSTRTPRPGKRRARTREADGAKLSLTVASRLVNLLGGRFQFEDADDADRMYAFTVPFGLPTREIVHPEPMDPSRVQHMPVLVVDHNATNRHIMHAMFINWHMTSLAVDNGPAAIAALEKAHEAGRPFALIILDADLPEMDGFALADRIQQIPSLKGSRIMMLTSTGWRGDAARCRTSGIRAYLTRPIKQTDLFDAIMTVLGTSSEEKGRPILVTRHSLRERRRFLRVLLIDSNRVDQTLAIHILEKRGHTVVTVGSTQEALTALQAYPFDVALIDVQMPELDRPAIRTAVRKKELGDHHHIKLVALTSLPESSDQNHWPDMDIDVSVSKPFRTTSLLEAVEDRLPAEQRPGAAVSANTPAEGPFAREEMVARLDGDGKLLRDLVDVFLSECPDLLSAIQGAIARGDRRALESSAYALRTSISTFAARAACEAATRLEAMGRTGNLAGAHEACEVMERELQRLTPTLLTFKEDMS